MTESASRRQGPLLFLSHSGADTEAALALARRLEATPDAKTSGLRVWVDKRSLEAGTPWQDQLARVIEHEATAFAVYAGSNGVVNWVHAEVRLALSRANKDGEHFPFIPIIASGAKSTVLPGFARQYQGVRDVERDAEQFKRLLAAVLGGRDAGTIKAEEHPFFGLKAIDEERSYLFFGRDRETEDLVDLLRKHSLVAVIGDSGCGKSSLVKAGLIPAWRGGRCSQQPTVIPDPTIWHVIEFRPGKTPFRRLGDAIYDAAGALHMSPADRATFREWAEDSTRDRLRDALRCGLDARNTRTLVVIDQFEELVTSTPPEARQQFVETLLRLADSGDDAFSIVVTMRRDFYELLYGAETRRLYDRLNSNDGAARYYPGTMSDEGVRDIVTKPLELAGVAPEERQALADAVVKERSGRPGDLALLQFALEQTWQYAKNDGDPRNLVRAYVECGRIDGALTRAAEGVIAREVEEKKTISEDDAAATMIRLARVQGTAAPTRRIAHRREFNDERWALLQRLASADGGRLVLIGGAGPAREAAPEQPGAFPSPETLARAGRPDRSADTHDRGDGKARGIEEPGAQAPPSDQTAEIAHEALFTGWERLRRWLYEAGTDKIELDRLTDRAIEWADASGRQAQSRLLARTHAEREAFEALAKGHSHWLSEKELAFVQASTTEHRATIRKERRGRSILVGVTCVALFAAIVSIVLFGFERQAEQTAQKERQHADKERVLAQKEKLQAERNEARALDGLSVAASVQRGFTDGALLALAAWPRNPTDKTLPMLPQTVKAILKALTGPLEVTVARPFKAAVETVAFSPDGTRVVTASHDGTARIWDQATGQLIAELKPPNRQGHPLWSAAFSPDGTRVVTASQGGAARIWNEATGQLIAEFKPPGWQDNPVNSAAFSPDGMRVVTASADGIARIWDEATGQLIDELKPSDWQDNRLNSAAFSPDGKRVVTASYDGTTRIWVVATGQPIAEFKPPDPQNNQLFSAAFSPDGTHVVTTSKDGKAQIWDVTTGQLTAELKPPDWQHNQQSSAAFGPGGARVVTASDDGTARIWDAATGQPLVAFKPPDWLENPLHSAAFSPDGTRVVTASDNGTVRIWDAMTDQQIAELRSPDWQDNPLHSAVFSPDGKRVVTASDDGTARIWNAAIGQTIATLKPPDWLHNHLYSAAFSPDGKRVVTASQDGTARIWNVATAKTISALKPPDWQHDPLQSAAFSPDGTRVMTVPDNGQAWIWDVATGQSITALRSPDREDPDLHSAAFNRDGTRVVTASDDGTARIWNATTGQLIAELKPRDRSDSWLWSAAFGPDGTHVATASPDGAARIWDVATGQILAELKPLDWQDHPMFTAVFSPDGTRVVTASEDGTAQIWGVPPPSPNLFETACLMLFRHSLTQVAQRYKLKLGDPICQTPPPSPDAPVLATLRKLN